MKRAKDDYDDLVARIRKGVQVPFGQMEELFAESFLREFLKRLSSEAEQEHARRLYQNHLAGGPEGNEYEDEQEPPELDDDKRVHYELELIRAVSSSLGVRPTVGDLSAYIQKSVRWRDWDLLSKILGLSREGTVGSGTLEDLAVEVLGSGDRRSYEELKKQFPDMAISPNQAGRLYRALISRQGVEDIKWVQEETRLAVPEEVAREGYGILLGSGDRNLGERLEWMENLKGRTGVAPVLSEEIANQLCRIVEAGEVHASYFDKMDGLFQVYSNPGVASQLQLSALKAGWLRSFEHLWNKCQGKASAEDIVEGLDKACAVFQQRGRGWREMVGSVQDITGVRPSREAVQGIMDSYLQEGNFSMIVEWAGRTGYPPAFEKERIAEIAARMRSRCRYESAVEFLEMVGVSKPPADGISREGAGSMAGEDDILVRDLAFGVYELTRDFEQAKALCQSYHTNVPVELAGRHIVGMVNALDRQVRDLLFQHDRWGGSADPLAPRRYYNIAESRKKRQAAANAWKSTAREIKRIKREYRIDGFDGQEQVQPLLGMGIEVALAEIILGKKRPFPLSALSKVLGVFLKYETCMDAILKTAGRFARQLHVEPGSAAIDKYMAGKNPGALLGEASEKLGVNPVLTEDGVRYLAEQMREACEGRDFGGRVGAGYSLTEGLDVLRMITGYDPNRGGM